MPRPIIHKTPEAKLAAAREKRSRYYARNRDRILKSRRELRSSNSKESRAARKLSRDISKAVKKALCRDDEDESESDTGSKDSQDSDDDDDESKLYDLPECLRIIKEIKDEMLVKINDPCNFAHGILCAYAKSMLDDSLTKADISIIETPMADIQKLLDHTIPAQDQILNFCGVSPEWHAADTLSRFLRTVLAYLEDIQFLALYGGTPDLTLAHSMGELMYQKGMKV
ncbi:uncharacterized protein HD556DRAFT_1445460 [Suillus plorans]|uniref:Uncharacterized protein n=1 Tax=Suillus plorans TaxID=116603 RepID=A0A9P7ALE8_9AGAM|nr:uncharacterized protein HD556DRAFT_1445460 [Suillus plorans]KAG1791195.1 hypothetical protein HD556DRAFT_1445460 [Suillus plorans]